MSQNPYPNNPYPQNPETAQGYPTTPNPAYPNPGQSYPGSAPTHARPHVGFGQALKNWARYMFRFKGRASRSEFWWVFLAWTLIGILVFIAVSILLGQGILTIDQAKTDYLNGTITASQYNNIVDEQAPTRYTIFALLGLFSLIQFVTMLGLYWRRLHDANFSGLFYLLTFIGLAIVPFIMCILPSKTEGVRFDAADDATRP